MSRIWFSGIEKSSSEGFPNPIASFDKKRPVFGTVFEILLQYTRLAQTSGICSGDIVISDVDSSKATFHFSMNEQDFTQWTLKIT